ncbi:MAG: hypothetical protein ACR2NP_06105 [Pirellulaceae bacterium]
MSQSHDTQTQKKETRQTKKRRQAKKNSRVADWATIQQWGWDGPRLARELTLFRQQTMANLPPEFQPDPLDLEHILLRLPDTWRIISATPGQIDGFWHFVPLVLDDFERAARGELHYGVVKPEMVVPLADPGEYDALFMSLSLRKQHRHLSMSMYLLTSWMEAMTQLAERGVFFANVCANLGTPFARKLNTALTMGFRPIGDHQVAGKMYMSYVPDSLNLPQFRLSPAANVQRMRQLYSAHFGASAPLPETV